MDYETGISILKLLGRMELKQTDARNREVSAPRARSIKFTNFPGRLFARKYRNPMHAHRLLNTSELRTYIDVYCKGNPVAKPTAKIRPQLGAAAKTPIDFNGKVQRLQWGLIRHLI